MQTPATTAAPASRPTPGPWTWDGFSLRPANPDPDTHAVHTILEAEHLGWGFVAADLRAVRAEADANLALIAAAPQLLDAARQAEELLAELVSACTTGHWERATLDKLRAAIAATTQAGE